MKLLFIHQNFPGQFKFLAPALAARGHEVKALTITSEPGMKDGVAVYKYALSRGTSSQIQPWVAEFETKVIRGEACAKAMLVLKEKGFYPDVVVGHPGWGETMFVKDVFPKAKFVAYLEFYYAAQGTDVGFDPEFAKNSFEEDARLRLKNANNLLALEAMDVGLSPTEWQKSVMPKEYQHKIHVIHDGIDTGVVIPDQNATYQIPDSNQVLSRKDEVLTFVNRNLEPYRGYHQFIRALPEIQRQRPNVKTLIVGGNGVSYGAKPPDGKTFKEIYLNEVKDRLDMSRIFFVGSIPYDQFLKMLQVSSVHVYLTYPFVLSWSLIEAMSAECLIVGSKTPPVEEVIKDQVNGFLVDFFQPSEIAKTVSSALARKHELLGLTTHAREYAITNYDLNLVTLPKQMALIESL